MGTGLKEFIIFHYCASGRSHLDEKVVIPGWNFHAMRTLALLLTPVYRIYCTDIQNWVMKKRAFICGHNTQVFDQGCHFEIEFKI
jgi:hypothetical protein